MKSKNTNLKILYQNTKKRKEKHKNTSIHSGSQGNDDSLDLIKTKNSIKQETTPHNAQQIDDQDLKKLRSCITNQFKKTNFINLSAIKKQNHLVLTEGHEIQHDKITESNLKQTKISQLSTYKKKLWNSHNRSQSCPFIQPIYIHDNISTKDGKNDLPSVVSSSMKIQKQPKKKISMQHLTRNRNKFTLGGSAQKKTINHNYSNSLTQSSNTVIVHNLPNQIVHTLPTNDNLSNILYKKGEQQQDTKTQKQKVQQNQLIKLQQKEVKSKQMMKKSQISQKTLHKKSLAQMKFKYDVFINTKIQQKMKKYQIKQERVQLEKDSSNIKIKQKYMDKLLKKLCGNQYIQRQKTTQDYQNSINGQFYTYKKQKTLGKNDKNNSHNSHNSHSNLQTTKHKNNHKNKVYNNNEYKNMYISSRNRQSQEKQERTIKYREQNSNHTELKNRKGMGYEYQLGNINFNSKYKMFQEEEQYEQEGSF